MLGKKKKQAEAAQAVAEMDTQPKKTRKMKEEKEPRKYLPGEPVWYDYYYMTKKETTLYTVLGALLFMAIGWVFYRSIIAMLIMAPLGIVFRNSMNQALIKKRKKNLMLQFKDMLYSLSSAVSSGSSVENAIEQSLVDMKKQYGEENVDIVQELELMTSRLAVNQNIEEIFSDFGERSGLEDIQNFSNIFEISKRTGGNLVDIIRQTSSIISEKIEVKLEMDTMLSGKKMEQKVLTVIPILVVFLLTEFSGGFVDVLFTTLVGRITSTIVLLTIVIGYFWSKKITDIEI